MDGQPTLITMSARGFVVLIIAIIGSVIGSTVGIMLYLSDMKQGLQDELDSTKQSLTASIRNLETNVRLLKLGCQGQADSFANALEYCEKLLPEGERKTFKKHRQDAVDSHKKVEEDARLYLSRLKEYIGLPFGREDIDEETWQHALALWKPEDFEKYKDTVWYDEAKRMRTEVMKRYKERQVEIGGINNIATPYWSAVGFAIVFIPIAAVVLLLVLMVLKKKKLQH